MSPTFNHINLAEQAVLGSCTTAILAPNAVTVQKLNINGSLNFNENQALSFRVENVTTVPAAGNIGRVIYNTTTGQFLIDNGTAFVPVSSTGAVTGVYSDSNPVLTGTIQFLAGTNVILGQVGQAITINATSSPITTGNLTEITSNVLTITGGTNAVVGTGTTIDVKQATSSQNGYLSSTDWNTFNSKQAPGAYITAITGDATASGPGSSLLTLATVNSNVGTFTNATVTVDAKGRITAVSNGSGSNISFQQDLFSYSGSNIFTLTFTPISNSQIILFNGIGLVSGSSYDYTLIGTTLTLNAGVVLKTGDQILVIYAH